MEYKIINPKMTTAITESYQQSLNLVEVTAIKSDVLNRILEETEHIDNITHKRWRKAQQEDPILSEAYVLRGPNAKSKATDPEVSQFLREREMLFLKRGVLYRKRMKDGEEVWFGVLGFNASATARRCSDSIITELMT